MNPPPAAVPLRERLPPGEAQVWLVRLDTVAASWPEWEGVLSADERAKADRFVHPEDRHRSAATRAVLRRLLGYYLELPPGELRFSYNRFGKPAVVGSPGALQLRFSVSHSGDWALLGFRRGGLIGVDIERISEQTPIDEIAPTIGTPAELALLGSLGPEERRQAFFRLWTLKEAYLKALGTGLSFTPQRVQVEFAEASRNPACPTSYRLQVRGAWTAQLLAGPEGFAAAVVVRGVGRTVRQFTGFPEE